MESNLLKPIVVTCSCGAVIPHHDIEIRNGKDKDDKDYGEVKATCKGCYQPWEAYEWGKWEDERDAIGTLKLYIDVVSDRI